MKDIIINYTDSFTNWENKFKEKLTDIIVKIDFDRTSTSLGYGDANVIVMLETKGKDHQEEIREELHKNGYEFIEM